MRIMLPSFATRAVVMLLVAFFTITPAQAQSAGQGQSEVLSGAQRAEIEKLIDQYLAAHPELVLRAIKALQAQEQETSQSDAKNAIAAQKEKLLNDPAAPVAGNPVGDVTIVEFFDYRCPYCKSVADSLQGLLKADSGLRLVYKELPILSPDSELAARAALAAHRQNKYAEFHRALMAHKGGFDQQTLITLAMNNGLDPKRLFADMESEPVKTAIAQNYKLAEALNIHSTPTFIIGEYLIPGAVSMNEMQDYIQRVRKGQKPAP